MEMVGACITKHELDKTILIPIQNKYARGEIDRKTYEYWLNEYNKQIKNSNYVMGKYYPLYSYEDSSILYTEYKRRPTTRGRFAGTQAETWADFIRG